MFKMLTHVVLERNRGTDSIYPEPRDSYPPEQNITLGRHCCADTQVIIIKAGYYVTILLQGLYKSCCSLDNAQNLLQLIATDHPRSLSCSYDE